MASRKNFSTLDQPNDNHDYRQNQENVNEASHGVGSGESKGPENK